MWCWHHGWDARRWWVDNCWIAGAEGHPPGHFERMAIAEVPVGFGDQKSAVFVTHPTSNDFEINPGLDGIAAKVMSKTVMHEGRQLGLLASGDDGALGIVDGNDPICRRGRGVAANAFEEFAHGGE